MKHISETDNRFCVPFALHKLTNLPLETVCAGLDLGDQPVEGVHVGKIAQFLEAHNWNIEKEPFPISTRETTLLIFKSHVGLLFGGTYFDNQHPHGYIPGSSQHPRTYGKLEGYWRITPKTFQCDDCGGVYPLKDVNTYNLCFTCWGNSQLDEHEKAGA